MARVLKGSHSITCTPRIRPLTEWTIPAFALPAEAGTHLPIPEGWKAEWPWVAGWLHTEINVRHRELNPDTVAHLSTNRARRRLTSLIEANALTTTPDYHHLCLFRRDLKTCLFADIRNVSALEVLRNRALQIDITYLLTYFAPFPFRPITLCFPPISSSAIPQYVGCTISHIMQNKWQFETRNNSS